jgi:hypothetical protein
MTSSRYEHQPLDEEVRTTAGHQVTTGEFRLPFQEREVLYLTGYSIFDSS